ncbi:helix-turn-helix domain-containing protein [Streptomyces sp. XY533]|uniref:helix-turn-helix domain-containing protein n=1 Tax=Streptomyces sp. XY533 TaxID=1519481 RepID=UPI0006AFCC0B|nr:helix-turn-helix domain-containing protein [Streptomyces sp. XY533]
MSVEALTYAARVKVGNITAKFVLGRLADRADERFSCYPSIPLIAAEAEKSERTVQRALEYLETLRLISTKEAFRDDGSQTSNRYFLHGPWDEYAGTGKPFPEIVTPKQARAAMWAQQPQEGEFREGTAAAVALSGSAELIAASVEAAEEALREAAEVEERRRAKGRKASAAAHGKASQEPSPEETAAQHGVTSMTPPPVTSMTPPPVSLVTPLEPSSTTPTTEPLALAARSAGAVRRTGAGSSARAKSSGSAAASKAGSSSGKVAGKVPAQRDEADEAAAAACRAVEAFLPAELRAQLPYGHVPKRNRATVLAALDSRTPEQLGERIARRWNVLGYEQAFYDGEVRSVVGVALELIGSTPYCPDPSCEDGIQDRHLGGTEECPACVVRRRDRRAARLAGRSVPQGKSGSSKPRPECGDCGRPFPGAIPDGAVCDRCMQEAEEGVAAVLGLWDGHTADLEAEAAEQERQEAAAAFRAAEEKALAETEKRRKYDAEVAATEARRRADEEETARLRAQFLRENPSLAAYATAARGEDSGPPPF